MEQKRLPTLIALPKLVRPVIEPASFVTTEYLNKNNATKPVTRIPVAM
jgi:hypothetical protein